MASDTTGNLLKTIIARILAFADDSNRDVGDYVGARVYVSQAPDDVAYPYVVLQKRPAQTDPEYANLREEYLIEALCVGAPRSKEQETELIADLVEAALLTWHESSAALGLSFGMRTEERSTLPPDESPFDRNIVAVRVTVRCCSWSKRLTNALT